MKHLPVVIFSLVIVLVTVFYTSHFAHQLAVEEQHKVEIWAEATRQFILAEPGDNVDFISTIIEGNTTIPVFMTDQYGKYMLSRNVELPRRLRKPSVPDSPEAVAAHDSAVTAYYQQYIDRLKETCTPIEVQLPDVGNQYIYYDESRLLHALQILPYLQLLLIATFIAIAFISITTAHKAEENIVWVGLCKETAHQLGTPLSSLMAWNEILKTKYSDDETFGETEHDIKRLEIIANRFSKIGSRPTLNTTEVLPLLHQTATYMQHRISDKISITVTTSPSLQRVSVSSTTEASSAKAALNEPLFTWVVENLIRNSVDAITGNGSISVTLGSITRWTVHGRSPWLYIDVTDTGKGIERRKQKQVFKPGYTTKQRGWGLGLSLARRIIEDYHHGKIFVYASEPGKGTTVRVLLQQAG